MIKREIKSKLMFLIVLILKISLVLLALSPVVFGIKMIKWNRDYLRVKNESLSWPETEGVITESYLRVYTQGGDDGDETWYETIIRYSYKVKGETYSGNLINLLSRGPHTTDRAEAETFITDYPKGLSVKVYYQPADPQTSILLREEFNRGNFWPYFWITIGFVSSTGISIFFLYRKKKNRYSERVNGDEN